jgi:hypothetical protein
MSMIYDSDKLIEFMERVKARISNDSEEIYA